MKKFLLFIVVTFLFQAGAFAQPLSAYRDPLRSYEFYVEKFPKSFLIRSPLSAAKRFRSYEFPKITGWISPYEMQRRFEALRDMRFILSNGNTLRRISWLYPNDGCFARAALFNRNAFRLFVPIPDKIFVFGNLSFKTPNHPRGAATWWYHVAPIVEVQGQKYVLDPAVEAARPLPLEEWLNRLGNIDKLKIAVCSSGTYSPGDNCSRTTDGIEASALRAQQVYLQREMAQLRRLGRNAEAELGDNPPW